MQKSKFIFVPEYPLDDMCSDNTSFEDYTDASSFKFSLVPEETLSLTHLHSQNL